MAVVTRRADGRFLLQWQWSAHKVVITVSAQPGAIDAANWVQSVNDTKTAVLPAMPQYTRPYFTLSFQGGAADGRHVVVAERFLAQPSVMNLRDIGGYQTKEGRFLRWGQLYRSGALTHLSEAAQQQLVQLGLRFVCDLRTVDEVTRIPDMVPADVRYLHQPLASQEPLRVQLQILRQHRNRYDAFLLRTYTQTVLDENATNLGRVLHYLADPAHYPALIHCAVGKDRTGVVIGLLLALLEVPDDVIIADYTLSNYYHQAIYATMLPELQRVRWVGIRPSTLHPLSLAHPDVMQATLAHICQQYGSVAAYVQQAAGVDEETLASLRQQLLQP